ncbi:hypothetical protein Btru_009026 [Bulinus truncatus]|nr:hypothetical protein Btru_009026 [Bulinus truncatus]
MMTTTRDSLGLEAIVWALGGVISPKDGAVLVLPNITRYSDGIYECVAFNGVDPAATREIRVDVQFAPEVTLATHQMGQPKGKGTVLACEVVANPHPVSGWRRNGKVLTQSTNHYVVAFNEKNKNILNLKIHNVQEADYGEYECFAENLLGSDFEIMILHEPLTDPPTIIDVWSTPTTINVKEHTKVDLVSNVTGNPKPSVTWSRLSTGQWPDQGPTGHRKDPKNRNMASFSSAVSPLSMFVVLASVIMTV